MADGFNEVINLLIDVFQNFVDILDESPKRFTEFGLSDSFFLHEE